MSTVKILDEWKHTLLSIKGVTGTGTASPHIVITVEKATKEVLANIPRQIEGIPTKIIETGKIFPLQDRRDIWRPMVGGISSGHYLVTAGTFSAMVKDKTTGQIMLLSNNHVYCYDEETEILTEDGWKLFRDLTFNDKVATMNPETGLLEYHHPDKLQHFWYEGNMIHFESPFYDLLVTPEHRVWCRFTWQGAKKPHPKGTKYGRGRKYRFMTAREAFERLQRNKQSFIGFDKRVKWQCQALETIQLPAVSYIRGKDFNNLSSLPIEYWLRFLGYYLSEGSATTREKLKQYIVSIRNKDSNFLKEVYDVAYALGFKPFYAKWAVRITNKQLCLYLKQFGKAGDKFVPKEIKNLPPHQIKIFLDAFIKGDGYRYKTFSIILTKSKKLADDLQELALKAGYAATVRLKRGSSYNPKGLYWRVSIHTQWMEPEVTPKRVHMEKYRGMVYDCTVKNHIILVRRNGKPIWSGNSLDWGQIRLGQKGDKILQPGPYDILNFLHGDPEDPKYKVGELERWVRVYLPDEEGQPGAGKGLNLIDAAVAKATPSEVTTNKVLDVGVPIEPADAKVGTNVRKSGRTTGLTYGKVTIDNYICNVYADDWFCTFKDTLLINPAAGLFAAPGDSGSLTLLSDRNNPVGLLFAGSENGQGVVCKSKHIANMLNIIFLETMPLLPVTAFLAGFTTTFGLIQTLKPPKI